MTTAIATDQFRDNYQFVAPANYGQNWVNVIAPTGTSVQIDGNARRSTNWSAIGASGYSVGRASRALANAPVAPACTPTSSRQPFGIQVYGYGTDTSYMYPGGLDLKRQ